MFYYGIRTTYTKWLWLLHCILIDESDLQDSLDNFDWKSSLIETFTVNFDWLLIYLLTVLNLHCFIFNTPDIQIVNVGWEAEVYIHLNLLIIISLLRGFSFTISWPGLVIY